MNGCLVHRIGGNATNEFVLPRGEKVVSLHLSTDSDLTNIFTLIGKELEFADEVYQIARFLPQLNLGEPGSKIDILKLYNLQTAQMIYDLKQALEANRNTIFSSFGLRDGLAGLQ